MIVQGYEIEVQYQLWTTVYLIQMQGVPICEYEKAFIFSYPSNAQGICFKKKMEQIKNFVFRSKVEGSHGWEVIGAKSLCMDYRNSEVISILQELS